MAFNGLRRLGTAVTVSGSEVLYAAAATGTNGAVAVMVANPGDGSVPFTLEIGETERSAAPRCTLTDETRTWEEVPIPEALPPHSFALFDFP